MISISKVAATTDYYSRDEYYRGEKYSYLKNWTYGNLGISQSELRNQKTFELFLKNGIGSKEMVGQDLTFSPPKSLSIAFAVGDESVRHDIVEAHRKAVMEVLKYIDKNLIYTRHTINGRTVHVKGTDMVALGFEHILSRSLDPQLHTHVVILNRTTRTTDGEERSIDFAYTLRGEDRRSLDVMYKTILANSLRDKGYSVVFRENGKSFELRGIPDDIIKVFSKREQQVLEYAREKGLDISDPRQRTRAVLETRQWKGKIDMDKIEESWKREGRNLDINKLYMTEKERKVYDEEKTKHYKARADVDIAKQMAGVMHGTVEAHEIISGVMQVSNMLNRPITLEESIKFLKKMRENEEIIYLGRADARDIYTTKSFMEQEKNIIEKLSVTDGNVSREIDEEILQRHGFLSREQEYALRTIYRDKHIILGIQGYAGTGKTALFFAVNQINERGKYFDRIIGLAPTGKAASELGKNAGIETTTIDHLLAVNQLKKKLREAEQKGRLTRKEREEIVKKFLDETEITKEEFDIASKINLGENTLVIIDEASMIDVPRMSAILTLLEKEKVAKVVLVGDIKQFQSVQSGKAFEMMQAAGMKTLRLEDIKRQKDNPELLQAAKLAAEGKIKEAVDLVGVRFADAEKQSICEAIASDVAQRIRKGENVYVLVPGNKTAETINQLVVNSLHGVDKNVGMVADTVIDKQQKYRGIDIVYTARGEKRNEVILTLGEKQGKQTVFHVGDRIIFLRNDRDTGVKNGQIGYIKNIKNSKMLVDVEGELKEINPKEYGYFRHAYALTTHKAQGATMDSVIYFVPTRANLYTNAVYVAMSRARQNLEIITTLKKDDFYGAIEQRQENRSAYEFRRKAEAYRQVISEIKRRRQIMQGRGKQRTEHHQAQEQEQKVRDREEEKIREENTTRKMVRFESQIEETKEHQETKEHHMGVNISR